MVIEVLCELTKIYDIRFHVVLAYSPSMKDFSYLEHTVMPEGIENVPPRLAIIYRNKYMLSLVDCVITYVKRPFGGAYKFKEMAQQKHTRIIELGGKA